MIVSSASPEVADRVGVVALLGVELRVEQQAAHADDRVHRRADLVAHRGEERALGLVGLLGGLARAARASAKSVALSIAIAACCDRPMRKSSRSVNGPELWPAPDGDHADDAVAPDQRRDHQPLLDVVSSVPAIVDRARVRPDVVDELGPASAASAPMMPSPER